MAIESIFTANALAAGFGEGLLGAMGLVGAGPIIVGVLGTIVGLALLAGIVAGIGYLTTNTNRRVWFNND